MDSIRFSKSLSEKELEEKIEATKSENSIKKAEWGIKIFNAWLNKRQSEGLINGLHVFKKIEEMSKGELNSQLQYFIFEVRKANGEKYPRNSLRDIYQSIGYYLNQIKGMPYKLFSDPEFTDSRKALDAAMKTATKEGIQPSGSGPSSAITDAEETILWERGILGNKTPKQILNTLFFFTGKFFGLRGGDEHRRLLWNKQVQLVVTSEGEYLHYKSDYCKNFNGGLKNANNNIKPKEIKVFSNLENPDKCFVNLFKKYSSLRPNNGKSDSYYIKAKINPMSSKWFDDMAVGHNTLNNMVKNMCSDAGIQGGHYVNHSLKKAGASALKNCGEVQRRALTGNRSSAQSVYECITTEDFKITSNLLYGNSTDISTKSQSVKQVDLSAPPSKKLKIDVDGNSNKISFSFY